MSARVVACVLVVIGASCGEAVPFASIALSVREPQGKERFGSAALTGLQWTIDKKFRASVSFDPTSPVQVLDINLGQEERDVDVVVFIGDKENPQAVGRADPFSIPAIDQANVAVQAPQNGNVFLAQPNVPELLVNNIPAARVGTAACDNAQGKVLVVGGADNAYFLGGALTVTEIVGGYDTVGFEVACDIVDDDNAAIAVRGGCDGDGEGGYEVTVRLGGNDAVVVVPDDELCDPFVRAAGDVIWVAGAGFVALHDPVTGDRIDRTVLPPLLGPVVHALVDDGTLIVQGLEGGAPATFIVRRSGSAIQDGVQVDLDRFVAADPNGQTIFFADGTIGTPVVNGSITVDERRPSGLTIDPVRILVISANDEDPDEVRVVGLDAAGVLQIEGEDAVVTGRESMAVTFGDAMLLFGGAPGHDVLVAPLSPFELEKLDPPADAGDY